jgi:hypothetical protein
MLFSVYALHPEPDAARMGAHFARIATTTEPTSDASPNGPRVSPKEPRRTPDMLPSGDVEVPEPWKLAALRKAKCERGDLNPPHRAKTLVKSRG